jgi:hypothetical protein
MVEQLQTKKRKPLPPVTPDGLFYIVVLYLQEGGVEVVTCEEKAERRMLETPGRYAGWAYVLVT